MKKRMKILAAVLLLPLALCLSAGAAEEDAQRGQDEAALRSAVTGEAQPYLAGTDGKDVAGSFARLLRNAVPDAKSAWAKAAGSLGAAAGIVILTAAARGFSEAVGGAANDAVDMAGALGISAVLLRDFSGVLSLCRSALDGISVFSATLQPVLAAALSMGGSAVTATTLQVASMFAFDLVLRLIEGLLVPAVCVYLAVTVVDAAAGNGVLRGLAEGIGSLSAGALKLILTLFTAYLAVAGGERGPRCAQNGEVRGLGRGPGGRRRHVGRSGDRSVGCGAAARLGRRFRHDMRHGDLSRALCPRRGVLSVLQGRRGPALAPVSGQPQASALGHRHGVRSAARHAERRLHHSVSGTCLCCCDGETVMNELLHTILLRVTLAGAASAAALRMAGSGAMRETVRLAAGLLMLAALLQPLGSLRSAGWSVSAAPDTQAIRETNMQTAMSAVASSIAKALESRAAAEGYDCRFTVTMATDESGILQVDRVTVHCGADDIAHLREIQELVTSECGVPAERQEVIAR